MKKLFLILFCGGLIIANSIFAQTGPSQEFVIYDEPGQEATPNFAPSGWMGDYGALVVDDKFTQDPYSGSYCQQWVYSKFMPIQQGWAGVYWQYPASNWGNAQGLDLSGYSRLTFWAKGQAGGEVITFKTGGIKGRYPDTFSAELTDVTLTKEWRQYTIPLHGKNLSNVCGAFVWVASRQKNPQGCVFYLDKIQFE